VFPKPTKHRHRHRPNLCSSIDSFKLRYGHAIYPDLLASRGFRHTPPLFWTPPPHLRSVDTFTAFKSNLKTHLSDDASSRTIVNRVRRSSPVLWLPWQDRHTGVITPCPCCSDSQRCTKKIGLFHVQVNEVGEYWVGRICWLADELTFLLVQLQTENTALVPNLLDTVTESHSL